MHARDHATKLPARTRLRQRLRRELVALVVLKLCLLFGAWQLWFDEPVAQHMNVAPEKLAEHFLGTASKTTQ